jgi:ligand-binding sensor domain-containing protein
MKTTIRLLIILSLIFTNSHISISQWIHTDTVCKGNVQALIVLQSNLFASTANGIFLSTNSGVNWKLIDNGLTTRDVLSFTFNGTVLFAGTFGGGLFRSSDYGEHWIAVNVGLTIPNVNALAVSKTNIFAGVYDFVNGGGVYRSTNNGDNWFGVNNGLTNSDIRAFAVNDTNIYAGTIGGVFLSTNNGNNWIVKNSGLTTPYVVTLAVSPTGSGGIKIFAGTIAGGVFRSTDNGASWIAMNEGLTNKYINAFAVADNGIIFAGTGWSGVFLSTNSGSNWSAVNNGMTTSQINTLAIGPNGAEENYLYAGTDDGVWRRPLSEMITSVNQTHVQLPENYSLSQNYPNPFNPSTTIRYALPSSANVRLTIYDLLGREIETLVDEEQSAGWKEVEWNASTFSSGIYFYKLVSGNFIDVKKMLVVK